MSFENFEENFNEHRELKVLYDRKGNLLIRMSYLMDLLGGEDRIEFVKDMVRFVAHDDAALQLMTEAVMERLEDSPHLDWWCGDDIDMRILFLERVQESILRELPWKTAHKAYREIAERLKEVRQNWWMLDKLKEYNEELYEQVIKTFRDNYKPNEEFYYSRYTEDDKIKAQVYAKLTEHIETVLQPYMAKLEADLKDSHNGITNLPEKINEHLSSDLST